MELQIGGYEVLTAKSSLLAGQQKYVAANSTGLGKLEYRQVLQVLERWLQLKRLLFSAVSPCSMFGTQRND